MTIEIHVDSKADLPERFTIHIDEDLFRGIFPDGPLLLRVYDDDSGETVFAKTFSLK